jgi:hypothetical protein
MKKPRVQKSSEVAQYIDPSKKVRVYRNLHKKCFSVKQNNLVLVHTDHVTLRDCKFIVSKAGQEADNIVDGAKSETEIWAGESNWQKAYYNPYTCDTFINQYDGSPLEATRFVDLYIDPTTINIFN